MSRNQSVVAVFSMLCASLLFSGLAGCASDGDGSGASADGGARDVVQEASPPRGESDSTFEASSMGSGDATGDVERADALADAGETEVPDSSVTDSPATESGTFDGELPDGSVPAAIADPFEEDGAEVADATDADASDATEADVDDAADGDAADVGADCYVDIEAGPADAGPTSTLNVLSIRGCACTMCAQDSGCLTPATNPASYSDYCEQLSGNDVNTCLTLLQCIVSTGCTSLSNSYPMSCFCGDVDPSTCFDVDSAPDGPCVQQYFAAAPPGVDPSFFAYELVDPVSPVGNPGALEQCLAGTPCATCFE